jgi:Tfp pilus assembly PilM family ATPase
MSILTSWQKFFFEPPAPSMVFQLSPSFLACFRPGQAPAVSEESYFQTSLPRGVIEANWLQPNIKQPEIIEELIDRAISQLKPAGNSISLILPEMSARALIFSVENGSLSGTELTRFVEWRLEKALAQPLSDLRYSYQTFNGQGLKKVLAVCSGLAVIKDYEELFRRKKLQAGKVTIPSVSLINLLDGTKAQDFLLVDVDYDYLSLAGVIDEMLSIYRQKPLWPETGGLDEQILTEVENTIQFVEDKNKKKPQLIYLRSGLPETATLIRTIEQSAGIVVSELYPEYPRLAPLVGGQ